MTEPREVPEGFQTRTDIEHIHLMNVGPSGCGKTRLTNTFPGPVCTIDCDNGMLTVKNDSEIRQRVDDGMVFWKTVPRPITQEGDTYPELVKIIDEVIKLGHAKRVRTIGLASLTTMGAIVIRHVCIMTNNPVNKPSFGCWASQKLIMTEIIQSLFRTPCHVVLEAHEDLMRDENTGQVIAVPMITGNYKFSLPIDFDEVWHSSVDTSPEGKLQWWVETAGGRLHGCGSRLGLNATVNNDFKSIMEIYKQNGGDMAEAFMAEY